MVGRDLAPYVGRENRSNLFCFVFFLCSEQSYIGQ